MKKQHDASNQSSLLDAAVTKLETAVEGRECDGSHIVAVMRAVRNASLEQLEHASTRLGLMIDNPNVDPGLRGHLCVLSGAMTEFGASASINAGAVSRFFRELVDLLAPLTLEAEEQKKSKKKEVKKKSKKKEDEEDEEENPEKKTREEIFQERIEEAKLEGYLETMQTLEPALVAHLGRCNEARLELSSDKALMLNVDRLKKVGAVHFARVLLCVYSGELLVLHPGERKGFLVRVEGVADNGQLHVLLANLLVGRSSRTHPARCLQGTPPSDAVAAVAMDHHANSGGLFFSGVWNMYSWLAVDEARSDATGLPQISDDMNKWIWTEGLVTDEVLARPDGRRVVLLGPPAYQRSFTAQAVLPAPKASVELIRVLDDDQLRQELELCISAQKQN